MVVVVVMVVVVGGGVVGVDMYVYVCRKVGSLYDVVATEVPRTVTSTTTCTYAFCLLARFTVLAGSFIIIIVPQYREDGKCSRHGAYVRACVRSGRIFDPAGQRSSRARGVFCLVRGDKIDRSRGPLVVHLPAYCCDVWIALRWDLHRGCGRRATGGRACGAGGERRRGGPGLCGLAGRF